MHQDQADGMDELAGPGWWPAAATAPDTHVAFRGSITVDAATRVTIEIIAASWWEAHLDGHGLDEGAPRYHPSRPEHLRFEVVLGPGSHVLAVHAHHYGVVRMFVGHGIGEQFHIAPTIPHYFHPDAKTIMEPGMTFTIEPMITLGTWREKMWDNGWTAVTADGRRTAQFEHTVLVTDDGVDVLTVLS